jgi:glyoxylase-like metal-dependent hydrolase (beta-lactamase superfamily II)
MEDPMLFKQLFDEKTWTYTYLLADRNSKEAVIIDPVLEQFQRDSNLIKELGLKLVFVIDTHVHADHITGSGKLRETYDALTVVSAAAGVECADIFIGDRETLHFGAHTLEARHTPGHTSGCVSFIVKNTTQTLAFTGDALFVRGTGRTDFQQGDPKALYRSIHHKIFTLPDNTIIYPGHDYKGHSSSTVGEEKKFNPRIKIGINEESFVEVMDSLNLAHPKFIDIALPANLNCGNGPT